MILAEMKPKPDEKPTSRKRPEPKAASPRSELRIDGARAELPEPAPRPAVEPLAPARHNVEFTASQELHEYPFARRGGGEVDNIRLLCRAHKLLEAELDYGKAKMDGFRVREPAPTFVIA